MMSNPFEYINAINFTKKDLMTGTENDVLAEKNYNPYVTNRSLSYFVDTLHAANEMNQNAHLDHKMQFHYLIHTVRPKKRFSKWAKKQSDVDLDLVKEYYGYNNAKAETALTLLTPENLVSIRQRLYNTGGM
jgi:hypothetical protein